MAEVRDVEIRYGLSGARFMVQATNEDTLSAIYGRALRESETLRTWSREGGFHQVRPLDRNWGDVLGTDTTIQLLSSRLGDIDEWGGVLDHIRRERRRTEGPDVNVLLHWLFIFLEILRGESELPLEVFDTHWFGAARVIISCNSVLNFHETPEVRTQFREIVFQLLVLFRTPERLREMGDHLFPLFRVVLQNDWYLRDLTHHFGIEVLRDYIVLNSELRFLKNLMEGDTFLELLDPESVAFLEEVTPSHRSALGVLFLSFRGFDSKQRRMSIGRAGVLHSPITSEQYRLVRGLLFEILHITEIREALIEKDKNDFFLINTPELNRLKSQVRRVLASWEEEVRLATIQFVTLFSRDVSGNAGRLAHRLVLLL